jgi:hypothetical protein
LCFAVSGKMKFLQLDQDFPGLFHLSLIPGNDDFLSPGHKPDPQRFFNLRQMMVMLSKNLSRSAKII